MQVTAPFLLLGCALLLCADDTVPPLSLTMQEPINSNRQASCPAPQADRVGISIRSFRNLKAATCILRRSFPREMTRLFTCGPSSRPFIISLMIFIMKRGVSWLCHDWPSVWCEASMLAAWSEYIREVFEAGLVVGIVMAVTAGVAGRGYWITGGVLAGVLGACVLALFTGGLSDFSAAAGRKCSTRAFWVCAVLMLRATYGWRATAPNSLPNCRQRRGRRCIEDHLALAIVVALREGSEVVLFLYGVAAAQAGASWAMVAGGRPRCRRLGLPLTYLGDPSLFPRAICSVSRARSSRCWHCGGPGPSRFLEQANIVTALDYTISATSPSRCCWLAIIIAAPMLLLDRRRIPRRSLIAGLIGSRSTVRRAPTCSSIISAELDSLILALTLRTS